MKYLERCVSVQKLAEHDYCADGGKGDEEEAEGGVDDAEEVFV